jgi:DNA repair ATPase RecN
MAESESEQKSRIAAALVVLKRDAKVFTLLLSIVIGVAGICGGLVKIGFSISHVIDQLDQHEKQIQKLTETDAKREAMLSKHDAKLDQVIQDLDQMKNKLQIPNTSRRYFPPMESEEGSVALPPKPHSKAGPFAGMIYETKATPPPQDSFMTYPTPK